MPDKIYPGIADLVAGKINPRTFSHADHLAVAFDALQRLEFFEAAHLYAKGLQDLTRQAGVPEKYHATLTLFFLSTIAERMHTGSYAGPADFVIRNADLSQKECVNAVYAGSRLSNPLARRIVLLPDAGKPPSPPEMPIDKP